MGDERQIAPAAERNKGPILDVLRRALPHAGLVLPHGGLVLEIASGTGQHVAHFAAHLPGLIWQPSDPNTACHASINAWVRDAGLANVRPALALDVTQEPWPVDRADAIVCINMIHISPWAATQALMQGAERLLPPGGVLCLYGPYKRGGQHTAPSNAEFDASLQARNPAWGVRNLEDVLDLAARHGLDLVEVVEMPANNLSVILRRR
ncbi:class I SAM-dependent methyltransferase [Sphingosinicellaceae bacterium A1X5R2]|nr:class I SAM-dependent methyltransferase [Pedomonas mirosovicensis]